MSGDPSSAKALAPFGASYGHQPSWAAVTHPRPGSGYTFLMAILEIVLEGDPRLRQKATKIKTVDGALRRLAADMRETMLAAPGVGLAAPQVGVTRRMIVVHLPAGYAEEGDPEIDWTLINPEIVRAQGREVDQEGCLSIPGWVGDVARADRITVKGMDLDGKGVRIKAEGWAARVLQHEIDHLDGILYVDRLEPDTTLRRVSDLVDEDALEDADDEDRPEPMVDNSAAHRSDETAA